MFRNYAIKDEPIASWGSIPALTTTRIELAMTDVIHTANSVEEQEAILIAEALASGAKLIPLTKGKFAIVDAEDYESVSIFKWHAWQHSGRNLWYARSSYVVKTERVLLHRFISKASKGL